VKWGSPWGFRKLDLRDTRKQIPRNVRLGKKATAGAAAARLSQLPLEKRALAATADGKRRSAGQRERIDVAVDAPRLLGETEPE
jgi:hypothetical protein